ncbi:ABC transporter permease [Amycolatopsis sp. NPDC023774]|uniref:ABC transporter permease n=1 Tax=Amycolatopsis sp. NPDC023774 TaxID=3155015 RepID=UPI0033DE0ECB
MIGFITKRLGLSVLTLLLVSIIVFAVSQVLPGDVGRTILGPYATSDQVAQLNHSLGLDRPLPVRYLDYMWGFLHGDWGKSYLLQEPVTGLVLGHLGDSLLLGGFALVIAVPISLGFGVLAALRRDKFTDRAISVTGLSLIALPEFVAGTVLLVVFGVSLKWFPVSSSVPLPDVVDVFRQFMLPAIPLMFVLFGYISRMARAGTVDVLESAYVRTAVLKGLKPGRVIGKHVLRNSLLPAITVVSAQVGYAVGGLVVVEKLFNYPGIGQLIYTSATGHDLPVLEAAVLVIAVIYTVANLCADLLYGVLNPRIRLAAA